MRKGLKCRVLIRGGRNSILVETEEGERIIASRYAVRLIEADLRVEPGNLFTFTGQTD